MVHYSLKKSFHNTLFQYRHVDWKSYYTYYTTPSGLVLERRPSWLFKISVLLAAPYLVIQYGLEDFLPEVRRLLHPTCILDEDYVDKGFPLYDAFMSLAKEIKN